MADLLDRVRGALADRYLVERELGRGAAAVVFLAEDRKHHRPIALKVLLPEVVSAEGTERFVREIETVARLNHPHILPLFDSGEADGLPYFVMPYAAGESLRDRLAREEQLPLEDALQITREVASALGYAHSLGIVHRDIKPANILLTGGHAVVADFGVARAISAAREPVADGSGPLEIIGTPMYMSPEQLSGAARLDGRSDLYSLGCVLYEMLAGRPPFAGPTIEDLRRQHLLEPVPSLRAANRELPPGVEELVRILLAKSPADRFLTAHQFVDRLPTPTRISSPSGDQLRQVDSRRIKRRWFAAAGVASVLVVGAAGAARLASNRSLDPARYALISTDGELAGQDSRYIEKLQHAMRSWNDLAVVSDLEVFEAIQQAGGDPPNSLSQALSLARKLGAGKLVRVRQSLAPDSIVLEAVVYDVASGGQSEQSGRASFLNSGAGDDAAIAALAQRLLLGNRANHVTGGHALGTRSVLAARAYDLGITALGAGRLDEAAAQFNRAIIADNGFSEALLLYAQTLWWRGDSATAWRDAAAVVGSTPSRLTGERAQTARALLALADRRYPDACKEFDALIAADSQDFTAWFGRGECHARDKAVIADPSSPSGWRFRSSYEAAIESYSHALRGIPSVHLTLGSRPYERMESLFYTEWSRWRSGWSAAPDSQLFAAWPSLVGDTLAFVPWPIAEMQRAEPKAMQSSLARAVHRNRSRLADVTAAWTRDFPTSARAHRARALALEMLREPGNSAAGDEAMQEIREARRLGVSRPDRLQAAVDEVRLHLKAERFAQGALLADSVLGSASKPDTMEARLLAGVAELLGRPNDAARLLRNAAADYQLWSSDGRSVILPPAVAEVSLPLVAYAAIGAPRDSIRALTSRVEARLRSYVPPGPEQGAAHDAALHVSAVLAYDVVGAGFAQRDSLSRSHLVRLQRLLDARDYARIREAFRDIQNARSGRVPSAVTLDVVLAEAKVALASGDTSTAVARLDASLASLPTAGLDLVGGEAIMAVPQSAALVRMMALRADLAAHDGDVASARRWADAVVTLWAKADPQLAPVVTRMRGLAPGAQNPR